MVTMYLVRNGCLDFVFPRSFTPLLQADPQRPIYDENTKNDMQDCGVAALQQIQAELVLLVCSFFRGA